jgi:hypothetical protein
VRRLKLSSPVFTVLTPLPGTVLFEELKERLSTVNYELFDLLHSVIPTSLSPDEFYKELADLYREAYPLTKFKMSKMIAQLQILWSRIPKAAHWQRMLAEAARLADARSYLKH